MSVRALTAAEREAERVKGEARSEAERIVAEGRRELDTLVRRREDINAEISRVQDVLEALESFEAPGSGASKNTVAAGAGIPAGVAATIDVAAPAGVVEPVTGGASFDPTL